ncbi:hypothetical protein THAOC_35361, partial [Thalassiosira oceanica]
MSGLGIRVEAKHRYILVPSEKYPCPSSASRRRPDGLRRVHRSISSCFGRASSASKLSFLSKFETRVSGS